MSTVLIILAVVSGATLITALAWPSWRKYKRLARYRGRPRYRKTAALLTASERSMVKSLQEMVGSGMKVYPNVRLFDLLELAGGREENNGPLAARVRSEVVDFVVCDAATTTPTLVVEMRRAEEPSADIRDRNDFVDWILQSAGLPLLPISQAGPKSTLQLAESVQASLSAFIEKSSAAA